MTDKKPDRTTKFTIDGEHYSISAPKTTAEKLIIIAGLDPEQYDLAQVRSGKSERFHDSDEVKVHNGDKFVTVRQHAQVA